ncbi:hypothetical protein [Chitinophaga nivalis]|uniref:MFS transporter n=1 Tax=Chitinophaga nivalis TaxID=2991709 RepID=A0ABT3ISR6_9BACT|nr:hypothetical protein [Chitinophaga nivalis]MCW3463550.1 hypothetical protein [Chitinophaga nivalis]MCW3486760.1 hypothetical protein [Chitinophaga nivalis]
MKKANRYQPDDTLLPRGLLSAFHYFTAAGSPRLAIYFITTTLQV